MASQLTQWLGAGALATSISAVFVLWSQNAAVQGALIEQNDEMDAISKRLSRMQSQSQRSQARQEVRMGTVVEKTRAIPVALAAPSPPVQEEPPELDPAQVERLDRLEDEARAQAEVTLEAGYLSVEDGLQLRGTLSRLDRERSTPLVVELATAINNDELIVEDLQAIPF